LAGAFSSRGYTLIYGTGMQMNLTSGDKNVIGNNKEVYDLGDWPALGSHQKLNIKHDYKDFVDWLINLDNPSTSPVRDTIDNNIYSNHLRIGRVKP